MVDNHAFQVFSVIFQQTVTWDYWLLMMRSRFESSAVVVNLFFICFATIPIWVMFACRDETTHHLDIYFSRNAPAGFRSCEQVKLCVSQGMRRPPVSTLMQLYVENENRGQRELLGGPKTINLARG